MNKNHSILLGFQLDSKLLISLIKDLLDSEHKARPATLRPTMPITTTHRWSSSWLHKTS
jgi:hypothetical protein